MKLIKSSFEIAEQPAGLEGVYKQIELAGRTCYKSEDKITEDSSKKFVDMLINNKHYAMLEHGTVYLSFHNKSTLVTEFAHENSTYIADRYAKNKYSKCKQVKDIMYITTNLRVLVENNWLDDLKYICNPTEHHFKRVTVKFILPISISREFCRHRVMSFAEQSTRYCNFNRDKFNREIAFIEPYWYKDAGEVMKAAFIDTLKYCEIQYMIFTDHPFKPQEAREILPLCTKSELVVTGFTDDWEHFFDLRADSHAHPQAQELAIPLKEEFINRGYIK